LSIPHEVSKTDWENVSTRTKVGTFENPQNKNAQYIAWSSLQQFEPKFQAYFEYRHLLLNRTRMLSYNDRVSSLRSHLVV